MNTQRVTVSLPKYIYDELTTLVNTRGLSSFVTDAVEKRLIEEKTAQVDPIKAFFSLKKKTQKISNKKILEAIKKGSV